MKRYNTESRISTVAALGAVLATTATIGAAVLLPTTLAPAQGYVVASQPAARSIAIIPSIEVVGYRTERAIAAPTESVHEARNATGPSKS